MMRWTFRPFTVNGQSAKPPERLEIVYVGWDTFGAPSVDVASPRNWSLQRSATWQEVRQIRSMTGVQWSHRHNEAVLVVFDPKKISFEELLKVFWEGHNPTQGMRQGNDRGTQYRSGIYTTTDAQRDLAHASLKTYEASLLEAGHGPITTEILSADTFYYAEEYHQQYLHKNPNGYCGLGGTGVSCQIGLEVWRCASNEEQKKRPCRTARRFQRDGSSDWCVSPGGF